eukprot:Nitzschia sp. Nitz4//scaffold56_size114212//107697//107864//NITZ4_003972-RA/size114212-est2genome-gene-0.28-mRNA-1//-1//CDS//3329554772//7961//frame0
MRIRLVLNCKIIAKEEDYYRFAKVKQHLLVCRGVSQKEREVVPHRSTN